VALRGIAAAFSCPETRSSTAVRRVPPAEWANVRALWREVRDVHDDTDTANIDDVSIAINVINETAAILEDRVDLVELFRQDYGEDYCILYHKLSTHGYRTSRPGVTSRDALRPRSLALFRKLSGQYS
jgi:hypothetical protein